MLRRPPQSAGTPRNDVWVVGFAPSRKTGLVHPNPAASYTMAISTKAKAIIEIKNLAFAPNSKIRKRLGALGWTNPSFPLLFFKTLDC